MTHFILLLALTLSSPTLSAGKASDAGQCVRRPDGSCRGPGEDYGALLQGSMRVDHDALDAFGETEAKKPKQKGKKEKQEQRQQQNRFYRYISQEAEKAKKAVREEAKRVRGIVNNGTMEGVFHFGKACQKVVDKACACAKLDGSGNCRKMRDRTCDGKEEMTGKKCFGFIETCAFMMNSHYHGEDEATTLMRCAGECRVKFMFEKRKYVKACSSLTEDDDNRNASESVVPDFLESEGVSKSMDETLTTKKTC